LLEQQEDSEPWARDLGRAICCYERGTVGCNFVGRRPVGSYEQHG
jgi:hypothetical protein